MLTDKRIIECEDVIRRALKFSEDFDGVPPNYNYQVLMDTADALAELLRWRERSNQIAEELGE